MLTRMGGEGSVSVDGGRTGTGVQFWIVDEGGRISRPGWPGRWKRRVSEP